MCAEMLCNIAAMNETHTFLIQKPRNISEVSYKVAFPPEILWQLYTFLTCLPGIWEC